MSEYNLHPSDEEIAELLKARLLTQNDSDKLSEKLIDLQATALFSAPATVMPPAHKEAQLLSGKGAALGSSKFPWLFTGLSVAAVAVITSFTLIFFPADKKAQPAQNTLQSESKTNVAGQSIETAPLSVNETQNNTGEQKNESAQNKQAAAPAVITKSVTALSSDIKNIAAVATTRTVTPAVNAVSISETKTATPSVPTGTVTPGSSFPVAHPVVACKGQQVSSCRIWKTKDFCSTPDSMKFPYQIDCDQCEYSYSCKEINKKNYKAVIVRLYRKNGFTLENGFHSIKLQRANGQKLEPFAINVDRYMNNVKKLRIKFKNVIDIILLFPEVAPGDKVMIDGVTELEVEE